MEEFEEMESDELLEYIGDVEQEKERALAGLEAIDAREESYQKQEEMGTIQEDLEKFKELNLATEVEGAKGTIETQREQLETLLNISQEKAMIRYIRINYDRNFMPHQVYEKGEK
jgi:hypothetical protein